MTHKVISNLLRPLVDAEARLRRRHILALVLALGALGGGAFTLLGLYSDWWDVSVILGYFGFLAALTGGLLIWSALKTPDLREIARRVEDSHPELRAALLTVFDQKPRENGRLGYLQSRVVGEVTEHAIKNRWVRQVSQRRLTAASWLQFLTLVAFCTATWFLLGEVDRQRSTDIAEVPPAADDAEVVVEISVRPGDVELEKGARIVIDAVFSGGSPARSDLVLFEPGDASAIRGSIPMEAGLEDTAVSALVDRVDSDVHYRIDSDVGSSDSYAITVFDHPRLEQADATVTPARYLDEEPRVIEDTRKVSLMEGGEVAWAMRVNKSVAAAELFGEDGSILPLEPSAEDPLLLVGRQIPEMTQKYRLHLVDDRDRGNKEPPWFTVTVKKNLPPKLEFTFPKRDVDVSAVQELPIEGSAWDDVGVKRAGLSLEFEGDVREIALLDEGEGGEHHALATLFSVEDLDAEPRDLIAYHLWAEDVDREGRVRRAESDMFFAEVRHFEDIFREAQAMGGPSQAGGNQSEQLLKLQKDVLNAAWKLIRRQRLGREVDVMADDVAVVRDSQNIAIGETMKALAEVEDPEMKQLLEEAQVHMEEAVERFEVVLAEKAGEILEPAHDAAKAAYRKLIEARAREHRITRSNQPSSGQGGEQQQRLMNLELEQKEMKYREESQATDPQQSAEQQENLAVLNRLKELARRQEAIAEKIKELENQLEEAESAEEENEIRRQLERLREEQEQLLRELDDVTERMDSEENRANMAEQREQLEETRENVREAAEQLANENLSDAANAATRAQRELEEAKEEFRKRTANQFAEEMKGVRDAARRLAENQERLGEKVREASDRAEDDPFSNQDRTGPAELAAELDQQLEELEGTLEQMKRLSEQAEGSEPILSDALYESVREAMVDGVAESLRESRDYVRFRRADRAVTPEQAAARGIEKLRGGVERAADNLLGNEADALRLARSELDRLIEEAEEEAQNLERGTQPGEDRPGGENPDKDDESREGATAGNRQGDENREEGAPGGGEEDPSRMAGTPTGEKEKGKAPGKAGEKGTGTEPGEGESLARSPGQRAGEKGEESASPGRSEQAGNSKGKGKAPGKGEGKGTSPSPGEGEQLAQAPGSGDSKGEGKGKGKGRGKGTGEASDGGEEGQSPGQGSNQSPSVAGGNSGQQGFGTNLGGDDRGNRRPGGAANTSRPLFFQQTEGDPGGEGPITGEDYRDWADRLGNIEEMLESEDLRNEIARVLVDARSMRIEYQRDNLPPGAATIRERITDPLVELRMRVSEELARLNKENPLAPIDRDPVPGEFRDLVRRYYEQLGAGE